MTQESGGKAKPTARRRHAPAIRHGQTPDAGTLAAALDSSPDAFLVLDSSDCVIHWNSATEDLFGTLSSVLQAGKSFASLVTDLATSGRFYADLPDTVEILRKGELRRIAVAAATTGEQTALVQTIARRMALHAASPSNFETNTVHGRWLHVATRPVDGGGTIITYRDITTWKARAVQLEHTVLHDPATGLPNRALFLDRLSQELRRCARERDRSFAIALIDIDNVRTINRSMGPEHGDAVLAAVARRIEKTIRPADTLARLDGDSFACIADGLRERDEAQEIARRIHNALAAPLSIDGDEVKVSASIGIAFGDRTVMATNDIMRDAAVALDLAKTDKGNGSIAVFDQIMHSTAQTRFQIDSELRAAIRSRSLTLHYQPIVEVETLRLVGFEALARWHHERLGDVPPGVFIRVAEESGMIAPLGRLALDKAAADLARWIRHDPHLFVTVNISPRQFDEHDLVADFRKTIAEHGLPADALHLEITESTVVENPERVANMVAEIKQLGVRVCIDDFGTGYSSLQLLQTMPYDVLKIDRGFVAGMADGRRNRIIMETITQLAHRMGMRVVAEGVERHDQLAMIRQIGCNFAQGYLFAPAMTAEKAETLVRAGHLDIG